jgi:hypothetical protein
VLTTIIKTQPSRNMRYQSLGDWYYRIGRKLENEKKVLVIEVNEDAGDDFHQFLIALHELVEVKLCEARGITQSQVYVYDFNHADKVKAGTVSPDAEPGDEPDCPYGKEHRFAMLIEHLMAHELGLKRYGEVL